MAEGVVHYSVPDEGWQRELGCPVCGAAFKPGDFVKARVMKNTGGAFRSLVMEYVHEGCGRERTT